VKTGDILDNKYRIDERIGSGGQSVVFSGEHVELQRKVAIKVLRLESEVDGNRLVAEARLLARLDDPHVVRIYDVFPHEDGFCVVMEFVDGETLQAIITRDETDYNKLVHIAGEMLTGLQGIHAANVLHRDLKPGNIFVTRSAQVKIADFGLAVDPSELHTLRPQEVTAKYLPPEVLLRDELMAGEKTPYGQRSDIYSAGFTLYELFLGQTRFRQVFSDVYADDYFVSRRWLNWHGDLTRRLPPLHSVRPDISEQLSNTIARMCEKDPRRRYQDVASALSDFRRSIQGAYATLPLPPPPSRDAKREKPPETLDAVVPEPPPRKSRKLVYLGLLSLLSTALIVAVALVQPPKGPTGLLIKTKPAGAAVLINEDNVGATDKNGVLKFTPQPGVLRITVSYAGFQAESRQVSYSTRDYKELTFSLKEIPKEVLPREIETDTGVMALVSAGEFLNGSEQQPIKNKLPDFYLDKVEVSNAFYRQYCDATGKRHPENPWNFPDYFLKCPACPVVNVTWAEAQEFASWAGKHLPAALEWEKAARFTDGRYWPWGRDYVAGNTNLGGRGDGSQLMAPVGRFRLDVSPWGVFDLAGNVAEWTVDRPEESAAGQAVIKGGSWTDDPRAYGDTTPVVARFRPEKPGVRLNGLGFRCGASVDEYRKLAAARRIVSSEVEKK